MNIFFDFDGPLVDNRNKYHAIYTDLLSPYGHPLVDRLSYWEHKRNNIPEKEILLMTCPDDEEMINAYLSRRIQVIEDFEYLKKDLVWDGIPELLEKLGQRHQLFMVTMRKNRESLFKELDYLKLTHFFKEIYSRDHNVGTWEVKVDLISSKVKGSESECLIIGDTEADMLAGKNLGIHTVAVCCGIRTRQRLETVNPDFVLENTLQLLSGTDIFE